MIAQYESISIDGVDRSGKSTLALELQKRTNYKYLLADRGPIGFYILDVLRNRDYDRYKAFFSQVNNFAFGIYLEIPYEVCKERFIKTNEEECKDFTLAEHILLANATFKLSGKFNVVTSKPIHDGKYNILVLDATKPLEENVQIVLNFIDVF